MIESVQTLLQTCLEDIGFSEQLIALVFEFVTFRGEDKFWALDTSDPHRARWERRVTRYINVLSYCAGAVIYPVTVVPSALAMTLVPTFFWAGCPLMSACHVAACPLYCVLASCTPELLLEWNMFALEGACYIDDDNFLPPGWLFGLCWEVLVCGGLTAKCCQASLLRLCYCDEGYPRKNERDFAALWCETVPGEVNSVWRALCAPLYWGGDLDECPPCVALSCLNKMHYKFMRL